MDKQKPSLYGFLSHYYDLLHHNKNYSAEANFILDLIKKYKISSGIELLDVACGTGKHLEYWKQLYHCLGVDISEEMLVLAKKRHPDINFQIANMINMDLNQTFDIITCLFNSIGYVKTIENLRKTFHSFNKHLKPGGIIIIEPWLTKEEYQVGYPRMYTYDSDNLKIAELSIREIKDNISIFNLHYLIAQKDKNVQRFEDHHELAMFEPEDFFKVISELGLEGHYIKDAVVSDFGYYIAIKLV